MFKEAILQCVQGKVVKTMFEAIKERCPQPPTLPVARARRQHDSLPDQTLWRAVFSQSPTDLRSTNFILTVVSATYLRCTVIKVRASSKAAETTWVDGADEMNS